MLVFDFTPCSSSASYAASPKISRNRLPPSQGILAFVVSNPAASSSGLWAAPLEPHSDFVVADRDPRCGVDEIAEQVPGLGGLVTVADPSS